MIKIARKYFITKPISLILVGTILFQIVFPTITFALTSGPTTPEVQSFEPIGTTQLVDPFSGDFNYNIPLMDVGGYPINLHYHAGIGMEQEASWVGLGWNINPGVINRNMRGIPDDFNGDEIKYKYNIKDNKTYNLSLNKRKEFEILGFKNNDKGSSFSLVGTSNNLGFIYNNYKGVGYTVGMDYESYYFRENHDASFKTSSIGFSSIDGFNISSPHKNFKNKYVGVDYNSRNGLENFHFNRTKNFDEINHSNSNSMIIPFQNSNYSPVSKPNFLQEGASFSINTGNESYGIFQKNSKYNLDASNSYLSSDQKSYSRKAYGYLNDEYADINSVMDKQNSGGYGFDRFSQYIGMSTHAYDLFNVSGQGIAGQFRPTRNQLGILWDARQEANSSPFSNNKISIELGKGKVDPTQLEIGADYTTIFSWGHSGKANLESKLSKNYMSKDKKELKEPVYFKNLGDLTFLDQDFYEDLKEENAFKISIEDIVSNFPSMPPQYYWDKYNGNINIDNSNLELKNETLQIKDRQKRNNVIQYLNTDEAKMYGSKTVHIVSQGNNIDQLKLDEFNYDDLNSKHLSEITTLGGDGSRYVYGLPALNKKHIEANFSVEKPLNYDNNTGLIKYSSIDASVSNTKGLDNFYQSTELPQYAYAYHLTAIFSPDYADVTGNGPTPDDFGSYTKFNYEKIEGYNWRAPFKDANLNKGLFSNKLDDRANYLYGEKDIWILRSVETKTHVAIFITSDREDAMGPAYEQNTNDLSFIDLNKKLKKLDEIRLYTRDQLEFQYSMGPNPQITINPLNNINPIKTVKFEYSYDLCGNVVNNTSNSINKMHPLLGYNLSANYNRTINEKKGKLTLHKVYFTYGNSDKGMLNPYLFEYNNNADYSFKGSDRWGTYTVNKAADGSNPNDFSSVSEFPYTRQNDKTLADINSSMWNLSSIYLPSGGKINIEYESDDYAYVQDKKALQMMKITGFAESEYHDPDNRLYYDNKVKRWIVFPIASNYSIDDYLPNNSDFGDLYFNMLVDLSPYDANNRNAKEYIQGYCQIEDKKERTINGINYGYIKINEIEYKGKGISPHFVNPITGSAFQFIKLKMPWLVYHGSDWNNSEASTVGKAAGTIFSFLPELVKTVVGYNAYLRIQGYANKVDLSASHIRLASPNLTKLGGGHRVKSIKINDDWNNMSTETSQTYGQIFDYTTEEDGKTISSGVASYEPIIGGDEIPHRQPQYRRIKQLLVQDNYLYDEYPICEELYPSASVGYSKVTVRDLKPSDIGFNEQTTKHQTGTSEYQFYTLKDFPTYVSATKLDKYFFKPFLLSYIGLNINKAVASQGYSIELNDMHGKLKETKQINNKKEVISFTKYIYKQKNGGNGKGQINKLDNTVTVLNKDGTKGNAILGVDIETVVEPLESENSTLVVKPQTNLNAFTVTTTPALLFTVINQFNYAYTQTKSVSVSKIIQKYGILEKVIVMKNGSTLATENIGWDAETGNVILTKTQTQYAGEYDYNLTIPAHYAYQGMEGAYKNLNANFQATVTNGTVDFPKQWLLTKGDELLVSIPNIGLHYKYDDLKDKAWVLDDNQTTLKATLIKTNGQMYPNGTYTFKVIRSGYRNMQGAPIGNIITTSNPIPNWWNGSNIININNSKILSASAIEYRDIKQLYPYINLFNVKKCDGDEINITEQYNFSDVEYTRNIGVEYDNLTSINSLLNSKYNPNSTDVYNPYALGILGVYYPHKSYAFYDKQNPERTTSANLNNSSPDYNETNAKIDGHYNIFSPFWTKPNNNTNNGYWNPFVLNGTQNDDITDKWTWTSLSEIVDQNGNEIQSVDPLNINNSAQFGYNKKFAVAIANNAKHSEIVFDGFEEYTKGDLYTCTSPYTPTTLFNKYNSTPWHWLIWPNLTKDKSVISLTESHTGKQSLEIQAGTIEVPFNLLPNITNTYSGLLSQFKLSTNNVIQPFYPNYNSINSDYMLTYWAKFDKNLGSPNVKFQYYNTSTSTWVNIPVDNMPNEEVWIDGWKKITMKIQIPIDAQGKKMRMVMYKTVKVNGSFVDNATSSQFQAFKLFIDDIRIMPFEANMVSYVYDNINYRLMATLNANHYATFYEYDDEGNLIRTKQETEKGIKTIQESRQNIKKR